MMQSRGAVDVLLAESFKELALISPIEKITIKEITDKAGVIRPTFYNHFQDKYELLEWIIQEEVFGPAKQLIENGLFDEPVIIIFANLNKEKSFYKRAVKLEGQNSFGSICESCVKQILLETLKDKELPGNPADNWLNKEKISAYYAQSFTYFIISWLKSDGDVDPKSLSECYQYLVSNSIIDVVKNSKMK